jgi:PHD-zinc-finger like domain
VVWQVCYGLGKDVKKDDFTCQRCQYFETYATNRSRSSDSQELPVVSCALCPRPGGVFKRTLKGQWVHLYCALNIEEVLFTELMDGIDLSRIPQQRRNLRCALCHEKNKGACMQCAGACYKPFHPMCARNANWFLTFIEVDGQSSVRMFAERILTLPGFRLLTFLTVHLQKGVGFCPAHTPADVKFNPTTQTWDRIDVRARLPPSFKRMVAMRKELEQARYVRRATDTPLESIQLFCRPCCVVFSCANAWSDGRNSSGIC